MNDAWLEHLITEEEERTFAEQGYMIIENAIPKELVERATQVADRLTAEEKEKRGLGPSDGLLLLDFVGKDDVFLELLDYPTTFPLVWGILGWNIQLYHSHMIITPPNAVSGPGQQGLNWHKDSGRLNNELETDPQPPHFAEGCVFPERRFRVGAGQPVCDSGQSFIEQATGG